MEINWISTNERMPEWAEIQKSGYCKSELVLILLPDDEIAIARYIHDSIDEEYWVNDCYDYIIYPIELVTCWYNLPDKSNI